MCRLLHLADVHLDAPFGGFGREAAARSAAVLEAFRAIPDLAAERDVEAVLIAGDLFDGPRPAEATVIAVREVIRRLRERSIPTFAVPGNHDARALNPDLYPTALDGAVVFTEPRFGAPATVELASGPLSVYGFAYDRAEEPDPLVGFERREGPGLHVVLVHASLPGAPHWGPGSSLVASPEALARLEVDYVALGDLHRFRGPDELEGSPACYPGSYVGVDFTESGPRGPVLVDLTPGRPPMIERLTTPVREVGEPFSFDVSSFSTDLEVVDGISGRVGAAYPVVVLEGEPSFALDPEAVRAMLEERHGAVSVKDRSRFFAPARLAEISRRNTIAGHVARLALAEIEGAADEEARIEIEQGLRIALRVMEIS